MACAQRLPDEIMLKIIRECIKPYSVRVYSLSAEALRCTRDEMAVVNRHCEVAGFTHRDSRAFTNHSRGLLVHDFATYGLEVLTGLPNVQNLILVSRFFYHEVLFTVQRRFNGRVQIVEVDRRRQTSIHNGSHLAEFFSAGLAHDADKLAWLKPRIKTITIDTTSRKSYPCPILDEAETPNLRRLIVKSHMQNIMRNIDLSGKDDDRIIRYIENHIADEARWRFDIATHRTRGIEIHGEVVISLGEPDVTHHRTGKLQDYMLKVDLTRAGTYKIRGRKLLQTRGGPTLKVEPIKSVFSPREILEFAHFNMDPVPWSEDMSILDFEISMLED